MFYLIHHFVNRTWIEGYSTAFRDMAFLDYTAHQEVHARLWYAVLLLSTSIWNGLAAGRLALHLTVILVDRNLSPREQIGSLARYR